MKTPFVLAVLAPIALAATPVFAADKAACLDAASKAQTLSDLHKLVEARDQLRVCAAAQCPAVVQSDCANWLADVEKALPSVVLGAKDGSGSDLVDVKVSVDGQPLVSRLDGQAVTLNAGPHTFHFEGANGASGDRQVVVKEGEKNQEVAVVLQGTPAAAPPVVAPVAAPPSPAPAAPQPQPAPPPAPEAASAAPSSGGSSPLKTVGWVAAGAGVVGLGVGTAFGFIAMGDKSSANCNANNQCQAGPLSSAKSAASIADIGFIAGGVLLAGGAALVLFGPSANGAQNKSTASVRVAPLVSAGTGGLVLGGSW